MKNYSDILEQFDLKEKLFSDCHLYYRNYIGFVNQHLLDFYIQSELQKKPSSLLPKKITRRDVETFFSISSETQFISEVFCFNLYRRYDRKMKLLNDFKQNNESIRSFSVNQMVSTFEKSIFRQKTEKKTNQNFKSVFFQQKSKLKDILFSWRHSASCFSLSYHKIIECFNIADIEERMILIKSQMIMLKDRAEKESRKRKTKEQKIKSISQRLSNSFNIRYLSGRTNSFFEKSLFLKYTKNYQEDYSEKYTHFRHKQNTLVIEDKLDDHKKSVFNSQMDKSLFKNTFNISKKIEFQNTLSKQIELQSHFAFSSFFQKPNMFLLLQNNSFSLLNGLLSKSVFYLEAFDHLK